MTVITMSRKELTRLRVLIDVADGRLSVSDATGLIGVERRQIYRLLDAFRARGATLVVMAGLRSGHPRAATDWIDREGGADHRGKPGDDDVRYRSTVLWRPAVGELLAARCAESRSS
jgi:Homeodomain-like domain-containing protein